jgi:hypothetical protein
MTLRGSLSERSPGGTVDFSVEFYNRSLPQCP